MIRIEKLCWTRNDCGLWRYHVFRSSVGIPVAPGTSSHMIRYPSDLEGTPPHTNRHSHGFLENCLQDQIYQWSLRIPPTGTGKPMVHIEYKIMYTKSP